MSLSQVAIVLNESEENILELAKTMHVWLAGTEINNKIYSSANVKLFPENLSFSLFEIPESSDTEEQCIIGLDLVEVHHSSAFDGIPWLEIQVYGCPLTQKLQRGFLEFGNTKISKEEYGFKVSREVEK
jgi:hypothetical protein